MERNILKTGSLVVYDTECGAFYGELLDMRKAGIEPENGQLVVEHTKTGKKIPFEFVKNDFNMAKTEKLAEIYTNKKLDVKLVLFESI